MTCRCTVIARGTPPTEFEIQDTTSSNKKSIVTCYNGNGLWWPSFPFAAGFDICYNEHTMLPVSACSLWRFPQDTVCSHDTTTLVWQTEHLQNYAKCIIENLLHTTCQRLYHQSLAKIGISDQTRVQLTHFQTSNYMVITSSYHHAAFLQASRSAGVRTHIDS